ncbi:hypothetical protein I4U23_011426 [Adineta vaga]|nr:hypothetical protein I4U23_011426 [Adineta vaga]
MIRLSYICFLLFGLVYTVHGTRSRLQRRQVNGCGPGYFNIDASLQLVGEGVLISCCNAHDRCYDTCGRTQASCDNDFRVCLNSVCGRLKGWFEWWEQFRQSACKLDGRNLYQVVNAIGSFAYNSAQKKHGCKTG